MQNCELFFVRGGKDFDDLSLLFNENKKLINVEDIVVKYQTNVSPVGIKIDEALDISLNDDSNLDCFIFANALTTKDSASFKNLFYDFITTREKELQKNENNEKAKIRVSSIGDLGNGYKGYCFSIDGKKFIALPKASLCGKSNEDLLNEGVQKACECLREKENDNPNGLVYVKDEKKKQTFIQSLFPQKEDDKKVKTRKVVSLIASVVLFAAIVYFIMTLIVLPLLNNRINSEIQDIAYNNTDPSANGPAQDWTALKEINDEIVGWITLDGTKIDYPVVEHIGDDEDGQYYLYRTYKKDWSLYGCCFMDYRSTDSVHSKNVIIHGHNMNDGSMFHALMDYGGLDGDIDFYKEHPIIKFNTPEEDAEWKIISVFKTSTLFSHGEFFNYMQGTFNSDAEFMNFVYNVRIRSLFNCPVTVNEDDQLLTLSTCSYEFSNWRTVVVARKVRKGESKDVDVSKATYNDDVVFPDVYYSRYGGERPEVLTFKTAHEKGLLPWYDGKGNLKGSEILTGTVAANPTEAPPEPEKKEDKKKNDNKSYVYYTINYLDAEGDVYTSYVVKEGDPVPIPDSHPSMPSDDYYDYTFTGWDLNGFDMDHCYYGMNIAPQYEATMR